MKGTAAKAVSGTSGLTMAVPQGRWGSGAGAAGGDLADRLARMGVIALFTLMAMRIGSDFLATGRPTGLLLLASELLVVILTVLRRPSMMVDRSHPARLLTACSMLGPLFVRPASVAPFATELTTALASAGGLAIVIGGKLSLGRSFGLMPANRGIVCTGLYRLVRHPIYLGYLITHVAFLAAHPTMWNGGILLVADVALMWRAIFEERTLQQDPAYRAYQQRVRWRVLPGLF